MLKQMRENTKTILWITIIAFVGLIILVWGADLQMGKSGQQRGEIGSVNGEPIPYPAYQEAYRRTLADYRERAGADPDERTELLLRNQVWSSLVDQILLNQEAEKRNINVTDEEIIETIRSNPPDFIRLAPELQTDGRFDFAKYNQLLQNPDMDWRPIEQQLRATMPMQKLQMIVRASVKVTDPEVRDAYIFRNETAKVAFALVSAGDFAVDGASATDADLERYYNENKDNYKVPPQAKLEFALVPRGATPADEEQIQQTLASALQQAQEGVDFTELVDNFSEASPAFRGGPTGMYLSLGQMPAEMSRRAAGMLPGATSDVFKDGDSYHLFRVEDRRTEADGDKFKIQDIQMPVKPSDDTIQSLSQRAIDISREAEEKGLAAAARDHGAIIDTTAWFAEASIVRELAQMPEAIKWAHKHSKGEVSKPMETLMGWFVLHVFDRRPEQVLSFAEVKEQLRGDWVEAKRLELASTHADGVRVRLMAGAPFDRAALGDSLVETGESTDFARSGSITKLGRDPEVIGAAFSLPVGQVSPVIVGAGGAVIIKVLSRAPIQETAFQAAKEQLAQQIAREKQNLVYNEWLQKLRDSAKIEDYREISVAG